MNAEAIVEERPFQGRVTAWRLVPFRARGRFHCAGKKRPGLKPVITKAL